MTAKERLQQIVSEMSEEEAADALALVAGARAGATPTDIYGTAWGKVLADADPQPPGRDRHPNDRDPGCHSRRPRALDATLRQTLNGTSA